MYNIAHPYRIELLRQGSSVMESRGWARLGLFGDGKQGVVQDGRFETSVVICAEGKLQHEIVSACKRRCLGEMCGEGEVLAMMR